MPDLTSVVPVVAFGSLMTGPAVTGGWFPGRSDDRPAAVTVGQPR